MEQQNNSDKTTFKVKFLGDYHDMVIDWNDDKYEYKQQQVFEQLASLTGIPIKYIKDFVLYEATPVDAHGQRGFEWRHFDNITNLSPDTHPGIPTFVKDNIHNVCIENGEHFHLSFNPFYDSSFMKRIGIIYELVPETSVQEGVCNYMFCQHMNTKSYFNRVKDLVCNDDLNSQISQRVQPIMEMRNNHDDYRFLIPETDKVFREFNVQQFLLNYCDYYYRQSVEDGDSLQDELYLRMCG